MDKKPIMLYSLIPLFIICEPLKGLVWSLMGEKPSTSRNTSQTNKSSIIN